MSRFILSIFALLACCQAQSAGIIKNCKRTLHMLEPDVIIYTNDLTFKPEVTINQKQVFLEYIVAEDYKNTLVDLVVRDLTRMDEPMEIESITSSKLFDRNSHYNETDFMWYRIDITNLLQDSRDG